MCHQYYLLFKRDNFSKIRYLETMDVPQIMNADYAIIELISISMQRCFSIKKNYNLWLIHDWKFFFRCQDKTLTKDPFIVKKGFKFWKSVLNYLIRILKEIEWIIFSLWKKLCFQSKCENESLVSNDKKIQHFIYHYMQKLVYK